MKDDYFEGRIINWDDKLERCYWRRIGFLVFAALALGAILYPLVAKADPMLRMSDGRVSITVYNEPCKLKTVENLPWRATWEEDGKKYEGCVRPFPEYQVAAAYFEDKTVAVIPLGAFAKVSGA